MAQGAFTARVLSLGTALAITSFTSPSGARELPLDDRISAAPPGVEASPSNATPSNAPSMTLPGDVPPRALAMQIAAILDDDLRQLSGTVVVQWRHPAPQALSNVHLHLYLNGFNHEGTTWAKTARHLRAPSLRRHARAHPDPWGWIEVKEIVQETEGGPKTIAPEQRQFIRPDDPTPLDRSLMEVVLPRAVLPGETLRLRITFEARLPIIMARTGVRGDYAHVAQWFPKLGVFDPQRGWVARQFHGATEFFAPFADYDVRLSVPSDVTLVATGKAVPGEQTLSGDGRRTVARFVQPAVHDFAFVVGRRLHRETHPYRPQGAERAVSITYVTPVATAHQVPRMRRAAEITFDVMSSRVAPYPYETMTVVQPPWEARASAGMEYPTLVTGMPGDALFDLPGFDGSLAQESTIAHEIIHNTFQGVVANDEQQHAFLDEGFTSYWTSQVVEELSRHGPSHMVGIPLDFDAWRRRMIGTLAPLIREPVMRRPAALFYPNTHGVQIYSRPLMTLKTAQALFGRESLDALFAAYVSRWRFRHPTAEDFLEVAKDTGPSGLYAFLCEALLSPTLPDYEIAFAESVPWQVPWGRHPVGAAWRLVDDDTEEDDRRARFALEPRAQEAEGRLVMEITDPGWVAADGEQVGKVTLHAVSHDAPLAAPDADIYESQVRVRGGGWRHLPVQVELLFSDGARVLDTWDGRSAWRGYRFVRPAKLVSARVDPEGHIFLDPVPTNNVWRATPQTEGSRRWAVWLGQLLVWGAMQAGWWL